MRSRHSGESSLLPSTGTFIATGFFLGLVGLLAMLAFFGARTAASTLGLSATYGAAGANAGGPTEWLSALGWALLSLVVVTVPPLVFLDKTRGPTTRR